MTTCLYMNHDDLFLQSVGLIFRNTSRALTSSSVILICVVDKLALPDR